MVPGTLSPGIVVRLQDLYTGSPFVLPNQSLRVLGSLERFDAVSGIAVLTDGESSLRLDLQHLRELPLRVGSLFEFVGELELHPLQQVNSSRRKKNTHQYEIQPVLVCMLP